MSINYFTKHVCWVVFLMCLLTSGNQVYADTGICEFGPGKGSFNFLKHNCKNGDTAIWRADADKKFHHPYPFIGYNCNLDGKLLQGIAEDFLGHKEAYVICEFQQKVERE